MVADGEDSFEPTERFLDRLADAFARASLTATDASELPPHVEAAVDDARVWVEAEFAADPDADLRGEVIPAFYRQPPGSTARTGTERGGTSAAARRQRIGISHARISVPSAPIL